ncbi:hypothetical protein CAOG_003969 [Capsaspora owczarzaki ATCC 30864]|uniref:Uncharacterized protein n=2 Tax=Capsaspora owczarzaki (strain ATCC 30864) TaxID=595528 RepID=A0A0D2VQV9_CAPO3|nr:hypothetical protein CAOG_003969 [Capsaspora owczarzaki ATCC 30864]
MTCEALTQPCVSALAMTAGAALASQGPCFPANWDKLSGVGARNIPLPSAWSELAINFTTTDPNAHFVTSVPADTSSLVIRHQSDPLIVSGALGSADGTFFLTHDQALEISADLQMSALVLFVVIGVVTMARSLYMARALRSQPVYARLPADGLDRL